MDSVFEVPKFRHTTGAAQKLSFVWSDSCLTLL